MKLELYSGLSVDVSQLKVEDVRWEDMIIPLTRECRYGNHSLKFYSVAHHLVNGYKMAKHLGWSDRLLRKFLEHDLHEAYCLDVPKPLKELIPGYDQLEMHCQGVVEEWLGLGEYTKEEKALVHQMDIELLYWEGKYLKHNQEGHFDKFRQFDVDFSFMEEDFKYPREDIEEEFKKVLQEQFTGVRVIV